MCFFSIDIVTTLFSFDPAYFDADKPTRKEKLRLYCLEFDCKEKHLANALSFVKLILEDILDDMSLKVMEFIIFMNSLVLFSCKQIIKSSPFVGFELATSRAHRAFVHIVPRRC